MTAQKTMHRPLSTRLDSRSVGNRLGVRRGSFEIAAAVAAVLACSGASAEEATAGRQGAALEEVVVTAQKRTERLLDVPMSVAAVSGEDLAAAGVGSTIDLGQITPGVVMTNIGTGFTPAIRGVSSSGTSTGDESNVALYVDDVYVGNTLAGVFDLPDIERVEVLKGPQGTLFGRNATGGAVRIVTRAPSFDREIRVSADYGFNYRESKLSAYVTGPISERVAGSISAATRSSDGYIEGAAQNVGRRYGEADNYTYRGKLLFNVSDTFNVTFAADTTKTNNEAAAIATPKGQNPFPGPGSVGNEPFRYAGGTEPIQDVEMYSAMLDANWEATDWLTVRSITAYRDFSLTYQVDIDRTNQPLSALALQADQHNFSQELNFFGPADATISWLVGAFYYDSTAGNPYFTSYTGDAPQGPVIADFNNTQSTTAYAAFADVTWHAMDRLHFTLGARYSSETKKYHYADTVRPGGAALRDINEEETWSSPTYRGVVRFDITPDANVYVSLSNGFKSGVFNTFSPLPIPVEPEEIDALEIGAKARLPYGMTLTAAAYGYDYDQLQVQAQTIVNNIPLLTLTNAASAELRGAELSIEGELFAGLTFNAGVNHLWKAEYSKYTTAQVTVPVFGAAPITGAQVVPYDASGSQVIKAPDWTANVSLSYGASVMDGELVATVNNAYNSGFNWQAGGFPPHESSFNLVNARVSWTDPADRYTFSVWGTNLTDRTYSFFSAPNPRGNTETFAQGRQVGVGIAAKF